jgi:hypothetical protein
MNVCHTWYFVQHEAGNVPYKAHCRAMCGTETIRLPLKRIHAASAPRHEPRIAVPPEADLEVASMDDASKFGISLMTD